MAVSTETESKGNVQALHVGKNFKTWLLKFLQCANLLHIKPSSTNLQIKAVELLKLSESLTFEEFAAKLVDRFDLGKTKGDHKLQLWARCQRILKCLPIVSWNWWKMPTHSVIIQGGTSKRPETKNGKKYS